MKKHSQQRGGPPPFLKPGEIERFTLPSGRRPVLMIGMLMYRAPHPTTIGRVIQTMHEFREMAPGVDVAFRLITASSPWWGRGQLLKTALSIPGCFAMWGVDDDMNWPEGTGGFNAIAHLMSWKKDMIGGLGFKRQMPTQPYAGHVAANGQCITMLDLEKLDNTEPFQVDFIGGGMFLVRRKVLEAVLESCDGNVDATYGTEFAWDTSDKTVAEIEAFIAEHKGKQLDGGFDTMAAYNEFVRLSRKVIARSQPFGEDYSFCVKVRRLGFEIWCDPSFELLHVGDYEYGIRDFIWQQKRDTMKPVEVEGQAHAGSS